MKSNRKIKVANNHTEGERIWIIGGLFSYIFLVYDDCETGNTLEN